MLGTPVEIGRLLARQLDDTKMTDHEYSIAKNLKMSTSAYWGEIASLRGFSIDFSIAKHFGNSQLGREITQGYHEGWCDFANNNQGSALSKERALNERAAEYAKAADAELSPEQGVLGSPMAFLLDKYLLPLLPIDPTGAMAQSMMQTQVHGLSTLAAEHFYSCFQTTAKIIDAAIRMNVPSEVEKKKLQQNFPNVRASPVTQPGSGGSGSTMMLIGGVLAGLGLIITIATVDYAAESGGRVFLMPGLIFGGLIIFAKGLFQSIRGK